MQYKDSKDLIRARSDTIAQIDEAAGTRRAERTTTTRAQEVVYTLKLGEAQDYLACHERGEEPIGQYPWLQDEADLRGITLLDLAQLITEKAAERSEWLFKIEQLRQAAKLSVKSAMSVAELRRIHAEFSELLGAL